MLHCKCTCSYVLNRLRNKSYKFYKISSALNKIMLNLIWFYFLWTFPVGKNFRPIASLKTLQETPLTKNTPVLWTFRCRLVTGRLLLRRFVWGNKQKCGNCGTLTPGLRRSTKQLIDQEEPGRLPGPWTTMWSEQHLSALRFLVYRVVGVIMHLLDPVNYEVFEGNQLLLRKECSKL